MKLNCLFSPVEYDRLMQSGGTGDNFYVKVHFNYDHTEHGETSFKNGEVFHVTDTLYGGVVWVLASLQGRKEQQWHKERHHPE